MLKVMTTLILGIGIGLFVISILWLSAALILALSLRINKRIGIIAAVVAIIIIIILISVPRSSEFPSAYQEKPYDQLFIWRVILIIILAGSSLIAVFGYIKYKLIETQIPRKIINWVY